MRAWAALVACLVMICGIAAANGCGTTIHSMPVSGSAAVDQVVNLEFSLGPLESASLCANTGAVSSPSTTGATITLSDGKLLVHSALFP